ncbi:MAG: ribonuclease H family protein [Lachnospiraceae bacterium]|nr:ribonuclease H family protein [Lachnospiraceae bacterium]
MAAKKFYAVRKGKKVGIFESWDACKASVDGFPGAEYKSFKTREEAVAFCGGGTVPVQQAGEMNRKEDPVKAAVRSDALVAYVDGSYEHSLTKYGFGCVFILPDGSVYVENGSGNNPETAALRNVSGEMLGAMQAVRWGIKNGFSRIELRYDYEGIEKWVTGAWKSKTELTQKYAAAMRKWQAQIALEFTKVPAHSNVFFNELADELAKDAVANKDGILEVRLKEETKQWRQD